MERKNSKELSDKDPMLGHCSRALDYYNDYEHSILGKPLQNGQCEKIFTSKKTSIKNI